MMIKPYRRYIYNTPIKSTDKSGLKRIANTNLKYAMLLNILAEATF